MASNIFLHTFFSYITTLNIIFTLALAEYDNYIIHMDLSYMPKAFSNHHSWYESTLSQITTNNINLNNPSTSSEIIYSYTNVMNGFSAKLSPQDHEALKNTPGYISSIPDLTLKLDTTHSPEFLGLNPYKGAWPASEFGKDIIVGVIDTGVWPESESFNDNGMTEIPSKWKGQLCQFENTNHSSLCNKKLIGARYFNKGFLAKYPNTPLLSSTRDEIGHGTHTSSTVAGNRVVNASYFGYANGTARGVATLSRVAIYKAAWGPHATSSDIIAAIDAAILEGVDVLSISLGSNDVHLFEDSIAIATFAAMEKGIIVATSAGNDGPAIKSLHNGTPWVITVAAGTTDRQLQGKLTLANGVSVNGFSSYIGNFSSTNLPIVFMDLCDNVEELNRVNKMIVVCEDINGTLLSSQINNLNAAKVIGGVFISNFSDTNVLQPVWYIQPAIAISHTNGEIVKNYLKDNSKSSSSSGFLAKMSFKLTSFGLKPAPTVDLVSSRGPSTSCPYVMKPDITAPGTSILAAWPTNIPVLELPYSKFFSDFNFLSGTSMSTPHVAGVAALLKGTHSNWSPAAIRSAIMTTSDIWDNTKKNITDIMSNNKKSNPLELGAGHVNPNRALDPGLVYDVSVQDYVNLLCALNFTQKNITAITRSSFNDCSKPSLDLNYPSFIAFFNGGNSSSRTITHKFHRTVTNVGEGKAIYVASVTPIKGFIVSVIPHKLVFNEKNEKISYTLKIESSTVIQNNISYGYLTWKDGKHVVRSPIVITTF